MTSKVLAEYKQKIEELKLIPSGGGCFELKIDGDLAYSKLKTGQFPDENWVLETVGARIK